MSLGGRRRCDDNQLSGRTGKVRAPVSTTPLVLSCQMGDLVQLAERRAGRMPSPFRREPKAEFFFDLACPFSYLVAERVERGLKNVTWTPASAAVLNRGTPASDPAWDAALRGAAERRARELRMPLVWPDGFPADVPAAMRAAAFAAERGRGAAFV